MDRGSTLRSGVPAPRLTQPPVRWAPGIFSGGKYTGKGDADTPLLSPKFRKRLRYTSASPLYVCTGVYLVTFNPRH